MVTDQYEFSIDHSLQYLLTLIAIGDRLPHRKCNYYLATLSNNVWNNGYIDINQMLTLLISRADFLNG